MDSRESSRKFLKMGYEFGRIGMYVAVRHMGGSLHFIKYVYICKYVY